MPIDAPMLAPVPRGALHGEEQDDPGPERLPGFARPVLVVPATNPAALLRGIAIGPHPSGADLDGMSAHAEAHRPARCRGHCQRSRTTSCGARSRPLSGSCPSRPRPSRAQRSVQSEPPGSWFRSARARGLAGARPNPHFYRVRTKTGHCEKGRLLWLAGDMTGMARRISSIH